MKGVSTGMNTFIFTVTFYSFNNTSVQRQTCKVLTMYILYVLYTNSRNTGLQCIILTLQVQRVLLKHIQSSLCLDVSSLLQFKWDGRGAI